MTLQPNASILTILPFQRGQIQVKSELKNHLQAFKFVINSSFFFSASTPLTVQLNIGTTTNTVTFNIRLNYTVFSGGQ